MYKNLVNDLRAVYSPSGLWRSYVDTLSNEHFIPNHRLNLAQKHDLFKRSVDLVEFEPHSFCNRKCTFCPNSYLDRQSAKIEMRADVFKKALHDLAEINYAGQIRFALYSEPLASPLTLEYIAQARSLLPEANIDVITNGDYLRPQLLRSLREAGLDVLRISIYPKAYIWDLNEAHKRLNQVASRIQIAAELIHESPTTLQWRFPFDGLQITAAAKDIHTIGFDRGGLIKNTRSSPFVRTSPCRIVFSHLNIFYDGTVTPCHNIRNDHPEHQQHVIDRLDGEKTLFDVYTSENFVKWRSDLAYVSKKQGPCSGCSQLACTSLLPTWKLSREIRKRLR